MHMGFLSLSVCGCFFLAFINCSLEIRRAEGFVLEWEIPLTHYRSLTTNRRGKKNWLHAWRSPDATTLTTSFHLIRYWLQTAYWGENSIWPWCLRLLYCGSLHAPGWRLQRKRVLKYLYLKVPPARKMASPCWSPRTLPFIWADCRAAAQTSTKLAKRMICYC